MDAQALALRSWQHIALGLALELAIGSAWLLLIALLGGRWRRHILLVVPPLAGFAWLVRVERQIQDQATYWSAYARFVDAHYPPERYPELAAQMRADSARAVAGVTHLGWFAVVVTECVVAGTLILLRRWSQPSTVTALVATPRKAEDTGNELEIIVEPLGVEGGDTAGA